MRAKLFSIVSSGVTIITGNVYFSQNLASKALCEAPADSVVNSGVSAEQKGMIKALGEQFIKESIEVEEAEGTEEWEKEKSGCSFCQHFLQSPCKMKFMRWSKCVDKSKDVGMDYVSACAVYTDALMSCTSEHDEWFAQKQKEMEAQQGKDKDK